VQANEIDRMDLVGSVAGCDCILGERLQSCVACCVCVQCSACGWKIRVCFLIVRDTFPRRRANILYAVDDMVDTAGTLCKAVDVLLDQGARRVFAFCSHGVLSGPAASRIAKSNLTELVILDTIPLSKECEVRPL
jgi:hypothetical protein